MYIHAYISRSLLQNLTLVSVDVAADNVDDNGTDVDANETGAFISENE